MVHLEQISEFYNRYSALFSLVYTILIALGGAIISKFIPFVQRYCIRRKLSLEKMNCKVIVPTYQKELHSARNLFDVSPVGDMDAMLNIMTLVDKTGLNKDGHKSMIDYNNYWEMMDQYNMFLIGGPIANKYVYDLFRHFFPQYKTLATMEKAMTNPNKIPLEHFIIDEKDGFSWGESSDDKFFVNKGERYAVLIKLTKSDFKVKKHGTVHIIFGQGIKGTVTASKYFVEHYKELPFQTTGKDHYFIAFKLSENTCLVDSSSFVDLTNKMLQ